MVSTASRQMSHCCGLRVSVELMGFWTGVTAPPSALRSKVRGVRHGRHAPGIKICHSTPTSRENTPKTDICM